MMGSRKVGRKVTQSKPASGSPPVSALPPPAMQAQIEAAHQIGGWKRSQDQAPPKFRMPKGG